MRLRLMLGASPFTTLPLVSKGVGKLSTTTPPPPPPAVVAAAAAAAAAAVVFLELEEAVILVRRRTRKAAAGATVHPFHRSLPRRRLHDHVDINLTIPKFAPRPFDWLKNLKIKIPSAKWQINQLLRQVGLCRTIARIVSQYNRTK